MSDDADFPAFAPEPEHIKILREKIPKLRHVHDFYDWPDKDIKERGIVEDALKSLNLEFSSLRGRGRRDPPDVDAIVCNRRVGFEVTEFVDQKHIERVKKAAIRTTGRFGLMK